jgi:hypothetical protein
VIVIYTDGVVGWLPFLFHIREVSFSYLEQQFGNTELSVVFLKSSGQIPLRYFNPLKSSGNYMIHLLYESVILRCGHRVCLLVNHLVFVMVKYGVLFEVRTEFLNII